MSYCPPAPTKLTFVHVRNTSRCKGPCPHSLFRCDAFSVCFIQSCLFIQSSGACCRHALQRGERDVVQVSEDQSGASEKWPFVHLPDDRTPCITPGAATRNRGLDGAGTISVGRPGAGQLLGRSRSPICDCA